MENETIKLEDALQGLRTIQKAIDRVQSGTRTHESSDFKKYYFWSQIFVCIMAGTLLIQESLSQVHTLALLASENNIALQVAGLAGMGVILACMGVGAILVVYGAARKVGESTADYISRHFYKINKMAFLSDLMVKFLVLVAVIVANKPEWFGPALTIFIADYIFQGRFFRLSLFTGTLLAVGCFVSAGLQIYYSVPSIAPALAAFVVCCLFSIANLYKDALLNRGEVK